MRGAPSEQVTTFDASRIIPADAGSTYREPRPGANGGDHPRGCGEHNTVAVPAIVLLGSSPRMRGAPNHPGRRRHPKRIIPADAGSTPPGTACRPWAADHPRGCGEHLYALTMDSTSMGSSPRMRGAHPLMDRSGGSAGIIPADAGSTRSVRVEAQASADHPRGCGEHEDRRASRPAARGSSPRMRGARLSSSCPSDLLRIIPADAGSTWPNEHKHGVGWDHPRGCGEHSPPLPPRMGSRGSSPRMRGARMGSQA